MTEYVLERPWLQSDSEFPNSKFFRFLKGKIVIVNLNEVKIVLKIDRAGLDLDLTRKVAW